MTLVERRRLAARVIAIYWLTVLGGLVLFTATRADDTGLTAALWVGACGGTLLGHLLALRDCRLWLTALIIAGVALYIEPVVPPDVSTPLWLSFVPAALCAFWSLGDRSALAAAWFPAVIWMLAILDRSEQVAPDGTAAVLLGGLAALFLLFLSAREARRVALWRGVAAQPLAAARPIELLRQPPGRQLARAGWWLSVGAITAAITVWLAPPLWRTEALGNQPVRIAVAPPRPSLGPPCCPIDDAADTESSRVREYLAIGLGHDRHTTARRDGLACRVCSGPASAGRARGGRDAWIAAGDPGSAPSTGGVIDLSGEPRGAGVPIAGEAPAGSRDPWRETAIPTGAGDAPAPPYAGDPSPAAAAPAAPWSDAPDPALAAAMAREAARGAALEAALEAERPRPTPLPVTPEPPADDARPVPDAPPSPAAAMTAPPVPAPPGAPAAAEPAPDAGAAGQPTTQQQRATARGAGPPLLHWLALAVIAAVVLQVVRLALRPLRRAVTLRHLRRPFWDETLDQRVSNSWQLALVGLRDAGWRTGASEAPRELARRTGVTGLDRCAAILERARHGVGLDAGDLAEIARSADAAYRAARTGVGGFARALGWLRWPLT